MGNIPFKEDPTEYNQRTLLATNVFDLLPEDHDCFIYEDIFNQIDTAEIEKKYSIHGQHAYHPRLITAILIYAYSQGIFSSREIEKKCNQDLSFMYIAHKSCPNFRVLSDFRKDNWEFFTQVFVQTVKLAASLGMVTLSHVSVDGSKFFANTSKHKAASYGRLKQAEAKLEDDIKKLLARAENKDEAEDKIYHSGKGYSIPEDIKIKKKRLQKIKRAKKALEDREGRDNPGKKIKDESQISYTDSEAKIMKTGGGFDYCYNGQISVDSKEQIIVSQHLTTNSNDKKELKKGLEGIKNNTKKNPESLTADSGYLSADNITCLLDEDIEGYIATGKGEKESRKKNKMTKANFGYDSAKDQFICPAGYRLSLKNVSKKRKYAAEESNCIHCPLKDKCSANRKETPTLYTDYKGIAISAMAGKMRQDSSKDIYRKRKIIVEPVFGQIKTGGFSRFGLRGLAKASGEFAIACTVSNLKKIIKKIKNVDLNLQKESGFIPAVS